jgi:ferredoxin
MDGSAHQHGDRGGGAASLAALEGRVMQLALQLKARSRETELWRQLDVLRRRERMLAARLQVQDAEHTELYSAMVAHRHQLLPPHIDFHGCDRRHHCAPIAWWPQCGTCLTACPTYQATAAARGLFPAHLPWGRLGLRLLWVREGHSLLYDRSGAHQLIYMHPHARRSWSWLCRHRRSMRDATPLFHGGAVGTGDDNGFDVCVDCALRLSLVGDSDGDDDPQLS